MIIKKMRYEISPIYHCVLCMKKISTGVPKSNPFNVPPLFPVCLLLLKEVDQFTLYNFPEISFNETEVSKFLKKIEER